MPFSARESMSRICRSEFFWLVVILAVGVFLRSYHFTEWLHFELDQARDALVVREAVLGGPGELTLLGMKAGGTSLRLGPGFYYLEYLSALLFGNTPQGIATVVPILSVASIVLFHLFARRVFRVPLSLVLTALFATSEYLVSYGRFAWNPNPLPFFSLLGLYALLRSVSSDERYPGRWFGLAAFAIGFATHLHFIAFLVLPSASLLFILVRRPRFSWKSWVVAASAFLLFYIPVALNEMGTGGANSKAFIAALTEKSNKEARSPVEKLVRNGVEHGLGYLVVTTGIEDGGFPDVELLRDGTIRLDCDMRCQHGKLVGMTAVAITGLSLLSLAFLWIRVRERQRSDVFLLTGIWFAVSFIVLTPLSYGFAPRFFLVQAPIPFLLLGFLIESIRIALPHGTKIARIATIALLVFVGLNLSGLATRFDEMARSSTEAVDTPADRILKEKIRVPLALQADIVSYLKGRSDESGYPIYMFSEPEHRRALKYLLERAGVRNDVLGFSGIYREGIYVLIIRSQSDLEEGIRKYLEKYDVIDRRPFGTLTMVEFVPKPEYVQAERQVFEAYGKKDNTTTLPRYTWREWWEGRNDDDNDSEEQ
ncbi:MAG: glycosyltransferase family 39 protein [Candidatus Moranbacteria bacterium]|nr:glycosyltransferase family 39 protein [Candidatus Moranbacteria bacterium]